MDNTTRDVLTVASFTFGAVGALPEIRRWWSLYRGKAAKRSEWPVKRSFLESPIFFTISVSLLCLGLYLAFGFTHPRIFSALVAVLGAVVLWVWLVYISQRRVIPFKHEKD